MRTNNSIGLTGPVFVQSPDQLKTDALAYLQNTDLADLFTRKDEDSPFELKNLPDNVRDTLSELEVYDALYRKVGIDLSEEMKAGNLYVEDGMYYINFKEKKIEKAIIKRQKLIYSISLLKIGIKDLLKVDRLHLENLNLSNIEDLKYLINIQAIYLSQNPNIKNYNFIKYFKNLKGLELQKTKLQIQTF